MLETRPTAALVLPLRAKPWARLFKASAGVALVLGLSACASDFIYKAEVVQGNFVSREQVQALRMGMPKQAVRDVLGSPLVTSLFHADRWDYAFTLNRQGTEPQQRRLSVFFKNGVLDRAEGDTMPTEAEFAAQLDTRRAPVKLPVLKADEAALAKAAPAPSAAGANTGNTSAAASANAAISANANTAPRRYPPLEATP